MPPEQSSTRCARLSTKSVRLRPANRSNATIARPDGSSWHECTAQLPALRSSHEAMVALDRADGVEWLDGPEVRARIHATSIEAGSRDSHCATIQPAKLARGLAVALEQRGVRIYEKTRVQEIVSASERYTAQVHCPEAVARAPVVSVSSEAWTARLRGLRRRILPVYSLIVLTQPLSDDQWAEVGWAGGECLASYQMTVDYLTRTPDGRIMSGGRGAPYHYGSRIEPSFDIHVPTHTTLRRSVTEWWPALKGIEFTHAWGGPLGIPRDFTPNIGFDPKTGLGMAAGYVGQGVATANVAGRYLAAAITNRGSSLRPLPFLGHHSRNWEPEPLRWLGARYIQRAFARIDRQSERTGVAPSGRSFAERLFYR